MAQQQVLGDGCCLRIDGVGSAPDSREIRSLYQRLRAWTKQPPLML